MPYIVVVIDEYGDYMGFIGRDRKSREVRSDILSHIVDLAQKGRAAGIHLVITTQRPSPAIITGAIKANFPTRLAFRTAARQESFAIIDVPGAERLIGSGDMLLECGGKITRVQGAYAGREEIDDIIGNANSKSEE